MPDDMAKVTHFLTSDVNKGPLKYIRVGGRVSAFLKKKTVMMIYESTFVALQGWVDVDFLEKMHYVTLEWPPSRHATVEPVLGDPWFGRSLVLCDHNHRHGSFIIKYPA